MLSATCGFLVGLALIPTVFSLGIQDTKTFILLPPVFTFLAVFGVWLTQFLGRWIPLFAQLGKFLTVGILNTAIDFGVFNILSMATGITQGLQIGGVNIPGFVVAVTNSYFWNKLWVFEGKGGFGKDLGQFLLVSIGALLVNSGIIALLTTFVSAPFGLDEREWLNLAKVAATAVALSWNFLGYKFIVFRK